MRRLQKLIQWDLKLQYKYNLVPAGFILCSLWIIILTLFKQQTIPKLMPIVLLSDVSTMGYMFIAAMLFFERGQGSIQAIIVTPVKVKEYIQSKMYALMIFIFIVSSIVVVTVSMIKGIQVNYLFMILSIVLTMSFYILLGMLLSTYYNSFTDFMIPSGIVMMFLYIPFYSLLSTNVLPIIATIQYIIPSYGLLLLMEGMFQPLGIGQLLYAILYPILWIGIMYKINIKLFNQKIVGRKEDIDV